MTRIQKPFNGLLILSMLAGCSSPPQSTTAPSKPSTPTASNANDSASTPAGNDADSPASAELFGTAAIRGKVHFEGTRPVPKPLPMSGDAVCSRAAAVLDPSKIVNPDGTVPNVFVYIKQGISQRYPAPAEPVLLDQVGCMYVPHVFGIQVGQTLTIRNSDPTAHNVHSLATKNNKFNFAQPTAGMTRNEKFTREEIMVKVKCDVHGWMSTYAGVLNHPFFAVTSDTGEFEITRLPAGQYTVEIWHETFQKQQSQITLKAGETADLNFTYGKVSQP
ncbi:MAG: carboxypeptidase regulatory-like domain-containing protein [Phycisphaerae bacterium]|nr:carboxypeptidase regulatory-like domain-containing protein [Phycisphaerae bacterium]